MNKDLKEVFVKQMLLPKEELALQTMELMADKMILEDNWNKLKEWLEEETQDSLNTWGEVYPRDTYKNVLEQMQEIEGGMNE